MAKIKGKGVENRDGGKGHREREKEMEKGKAKKNGKRGHIEEDGKGMGKQEKGQKRKITFTLEDWTLTTGTHSMFL